MFWGDGQTKNYVPTDILTDWLEIMEEIVSMALLHLTRGLIDNVTRTVSELGYSIMEESEVMAFLQPSMSLIDHATGEFNAIFGGNSGVCEVSGGCHVKGRLIRHGCMSHGGQGRGPQNYC